MKRISYLSLLSLTVFPAHAELVGHWPLDTNADDVSGNANHGAIVDGAVNFGGTGANANTGTSAAFPDNGHIEIPFSEALNSTSYTVSAWANPTAVGGGDFRSVVSNRDNFVRGGEIGTHGFILYSASDGAWSFWTGDGDIGWDRRKASAAAVNEWVYLTMSYDAATNTKRSYINGVLQEEAVGGVDALHIPNGTLDTEPFFIGSGGDAGNEFYHSGAIDDVAVWDDVLTLSEIQAGRDNGAANALSDPRVQVLTTLEIGLDSAEQFTIPVTNAGATQNLDVTGVNITGADSAHFTVETSPTGTIPGATGDLVINFDAMAEAGPFTAILEVTTNDTVNSVVMIDLTANIRDPHLVVASPLVFPTVQAGAGVQMASLDIENTGAANDLNISTVNVVGPDLLNFTVTNFTDTVSNGGFGVIAVSFDPGTSIGSFSASLEIISDDPNEGTLLVPITAVVETTLEDSLVAWWPLDANANDSTGNGFDGTATGDVTFLEAGANAATGQATLFSGVGNIEVPWSATLNTGNFTATLWVNASASGDAFRSPLSSRDLIGETERHGWEILSSTAQGGIWTFWNGVGLAENGFWQVANGPAVVADEWHHLAISYDRATNTKRLYVDAVEVAVSVPSAPFSPNNDTLGGGLGNQNRPLYIGAGGNDGALFNWAGLIDDVGLFQTALSQEQIAEIMTGGVGAVLGSTEISISNFEYDPTTNEASLEWTEVRGATEYLVDRAIGGLEAADWEEIDDVSSTTTTYTDFTLPANTRKAFYRVRAAR